MAPEYSGALLGYDGHTVNMSLLVLFAKLDCSYNKANGYNEPYDTAYREDEIYKYREGKHAA